MPGKKGMGDLLKKRMAATQQASELAASDQAYEQIIQASPPTASATSDSVPLDKLTPFFTADIGFKPYSPEKLTALSEQLKEDGLLVRIIVRKIPDSDRYEILAGHNRVNAAKLAGWREIPADVVEADDVRAVVIATSTNLIQRQNLSIVERGKAYKALLEAKNRNGQRNAAAETFGEIHRRYDVRTLVAEFFNVTEHEVRKAVKLTRLIPELLEILENNPRQLNLSCAELMADYDADTQSAFIPMCETDGYRLSVAAMKRIVQRCPPPAARAENISAAWNETRTEDSHQRQASKIKIAFDREKIAPLLDKLGGESKLEDLFLEFLRQTASD